MKVRRRKPSSKNRLPAKRFHAPASTSPPVAPRSALQIVTGMVRELARLQKLCNETQTELENEPSPSERFQLAKLLQQYSTNLNKLIQPTLDAEERQGLLLEKSDVEATWRRVIAEWRSALEALPRRISTNALFSNLNPVDVEQLLVRECDSTLNLLCNQSFEKPSRLTRDG